MAMGGVVKDAIFIQGILKFVQPEVEVCTIVYEENQGTVQLQIVP